MISLNTVLVLVCFILTIMLYVLLGINDFQPQKKQLLALTPLLALLLTLYRMDNIPIVYDSVKNENNTYETPIQQEEIVKSSVPVTVTQSKSIDMIEQQLQSRNQKITNIPTVQNEIKNSQIEKGSLLKQTTKSLPFVVVAGLLLSITNPQTVLQ